jgi:hypothetical protein
MKSLKINVLVISSLVGLILFYFLFIRNSRETELEIEGNQLVEKIEKYKKENGFLPNKLSDIGVNEDQTFPHTMKSKMV